MNELTNKPIINAVLALVILGSLFLAVKTIGEIKRVGIIGKDVVSSNVITVNGTGEAFAVPNIAEVTFDVMQESATVAAAQQVVTTRTNDIMAYLKSAGIEEKDIKTINYSVYPRYEYEQKAMICPVGLPCYPGSGTQVLKGYTVSNSVQVKIRKTEDSGTILSELGKKKVTNISGLNFTVEDQETIKDQAREKAIADAKEKAEVLAKQLGVKIKTIVNFSENGDYPVYFKSAVMNQVGRAEAMDAGSAPSIQPGENKFVSNVTITYEIR